LPRPFSACTAPSALASCTPLTPEEIFEQLLTFVVAGHETTATTLAWALYELHRAPSTLARRREELQSVTSREPSELTTLPYLSAVCKEALRRHPPLPIGPRRVTGGFTVGGDSLPEGQTLGVAVYLAQHRAVEFPEPYEFRPERCLSGSFSPFTFLPFGGGARRCLGAAFAMFELSIVLGTILRSAELSLDERRPVGNAFRTGTYGPATGVLMTAKRVDVPSIP
jgi:cytochrome P450 family 110